MENDLESWLRYYLAQNYSPEYLKTYLIRAGYDERTVDDAINRVLGGEPSQTKKEKLNKKKVLISLLVLYLIILCGNFYFLSKIKKLTTTPALPADELQKNLLRVNELLNCSPTECASRFAEEDCQTFVNEAKKLLGSSGNEGSKGFNCHVESYCEVVKQDGEIVFAPYFGYLEFTKIEIENGVAYTKCVDFLKREMLRFYIQFPWMLSLGYITNELVHLRLKHLQSNVWKPTFLLIDVRKPEKSLVKVQVVVIQNFEEIRKQAEKHYFPSGSNMELEEFAKTTNNCYTRMFKNLCSYANSLSEEVVKDRIRDKTMREIALNAYHDLKEGCETNDKKKIISAGYSLVALLSESPEEGFSIVYGDCFSG